MKTWAKYNGKWRLDDVLNGRISLIAVLFTKATGPNGTPLSETVWWSATESPLTEGPREPK
jgi:hypothetical protein